MWGRKTVTRDYQGGARLNFHLAEDGRVVAASAVGPISKIGKDARLAEALTNQLDRDLPTSSPECNLKALIPGKAKDSSLPTPA
jgi:3-phenylpropionate/trans-cinnamate dioxygenase ferredoxin reductase subunit